MMARLLWKEFREQRWSLAALWTLTVALVAAGSCFRFLWPASETPFAPLDGYPGEWEMLLALVAWVIGASAFASELGKGAADFLCSRPVRWQAMLAAKVILGGAGVLLTAVVAAAAVTLLVDPVLRDLIIWPGMLRAAGALGLVLAIAYLIGLSGSAGAPGRQGGAVTSLGILGAVLVVMVFTEPEQDRLNPAVLFGLPFLGGLCAVMLVASRRMTQGLRARLAIYTICVGIPLSTVAALARVPWDGPWVLHYPDRSEYLSTWCSPAGTYWLTRSHLTRVSDGKQWAVRGPDLFNASSIEWAAEHRVIWLEWSTLAILDTTSARTRLLDLKAYPSRLRVSPGGRYAAALFPGSDGQESCLQLVDLKRAALLGKRLRFSKGAHVWWQSEDVLKIEGAGQIRVSNLAGGGSSHRSSPF